MKVHLDLNGKPICNLHKRRAKNQKSLILTKNYEKVTCKRCRNCFIKNG